MSDQEHLTLRLVRLKPPEEWVTNEAGVCFIFSKGGVGKFLHGHGTKPLAPGDVLVVDGGAGGKVCAADHGELIFRWFSARLEHLYPLLTSDEICLLQNVTDALRDSRHYPASSPLARECHKLLEGIAPQFDLAHRGQVLRIISAILSEEFKAARGHRAGFVRPEEHMMQVFEKLSMTEILSLSVGELAAKFSCSRRHLNRLFHQHFGFSVAALRMEMRLLKAVSLLRDPTAKVINVAEDCGFNHLGLFNTCFKRRFGASPGQYRKMNLPAATRQHSNVEGTTSCPLHINGLCPWDGGPGSAHAAPISPSPAKAAPPGASKKPGATGELVLPQVQSHQQPNLADRRSNA
jgi:AraC-like DNA-binding protein